MELGPIRRLETADILMADNLGKLPFTLKLSRRALNIIKQNITFSLGIKLVALLLVILNVTQEKKKEASHKFGLLM